MRLVLQGSYDEDFPCLGVDFMQGSYDEACIKGLSIYFYVWEWILYGLV
jgi:hypothetical protein